MTEKHKNTRERFERTDIAVVSGETRRMMAEQDALNRENLSLLFYCGEYTGCYECSGLEKYSSRNKRSLLNPEKGIIFLLD